MDLSETPFRDLYQNLETTFKLEKNLTYERFILLTREQKSNERLTDFHAVLTEQATRCQLGSLEKELVKDLFIARMNSKELQKKFCTEKKNADEVMAETILFERGIDTCSSISNLSHKQTTQVKQESTFAIDSKKFRGNSRKFGRGGRVSKNKGKDNPCRNCGGQYGPTHDCPAKGQECHLCKRKGHFAKYCPNAKDPVGSIEEDNRSMMSNSSATTSSSTGTSSSRSEHKQDKPRTADVGYIGYDAYDDDEPVDILSIEAEPDTVTTDVLSVEAEGKPAPLPTSEVDEIIMVRDWEDNPKSLEILVRAFNSIINFTIDTGSPASFIN